MQELISVNCSQPNITQITINIWHWKVWPRLSLLVLTSGSLPPWVKDAGLLLSTDSGRQFGKDHSLSWEL